MIAPRRMMKRRGAPSFLIPLRGAGRAAGTPLGVLMRRRRAAPSLLIPLRGAGRAAGTPLGVHITRLLLAAASLVAAVPAAAHKASDAYLTLRVDGQDVDARVDVALRDLDRDLDLDTDADDQLTWREVHSRWRDIEGLVTSAVRLSAAGSPCAIDPREAQAPAITEHSDGHYAVVRARWHCASPIERLSVDYRLFAHTDPTHRGIARVSRADRAGSVLAVLAPDAGWHRFELPRAVPAPAPAGVAPLPGAAASRAMAPSPMATPSQGGVDSGAEDVTTALLGFVREGIHHILIGYDHILFLLSLLLPSVWIRTAAPGTGSTAGRPRWRPATDLRGTLAKVLKVVTAFTIAHSITLAVSVLGLFQPPPRLVESLIAASVVLAALNNLRPVVNDARWKLTFLFGLVHGFGFASALKDAGLAHGALAAPLLGFNLGVEIGQLCIVSLVLPLAWWTRDTRVYRGAFACGSAVIAIVAALWLVQRAFDLSLIAG